MFDPRYVEARTVLLDALDALVEQRSALVVVGAQAVYLRTGASALRAAPYTTDADLAVDPGALGDEPELEAAMRAAGFELMEPDAGRFQPGLWHKQAGTADQPIDVEVDLLVPAAFMPATSSRGARLPGHSKRAARLTSGLEAALVDHAALTIGGLDPDDRRLITVEVAGLPALLVAKLHKVNDRIQPGVRADRQTDKDAGDLVRIMLETSPQKLAGTLHRLLGHPQAGASTAKALEVLVPLFGASRSPGVRMAIAALLCRHAGTPRRADLHHFRPRPDRTDQRLIKQRRRRRLRTSSTGTSIYEPPRSLNTPASASQPSSSSTSLAPRTRSSPSPRPR